MFSAIQYPTLWDATPGILTPIVAIAGAIMLLVVTYRLYGRGQRQPASREGQVWSIHAPKTAADYLFWIAGICIASAAIWTLAARVMTGESALLVLIGTVLLVAALFKSGRSDATHWAMWLLLVSGFVIELLPYIRLHPR
jgi:hypothetical protein